MFQGHRQLLRLALTMAFLVYPVLVAPRETPRWTCRRGGGGDSGGAKAATGGRGRGAKRAALYDAMAAYAAHFTPLLAAEAAAEQAAHAAAAARPPPLEGVRVERRPRVLGSSMYVLRGERGVRISEECRMRKGDVVCVREGRRTRAPSETGDAGDGAEASVLERTAWEVHLAVPIAGEAARLLDAFEADGVEVCVVQGANDMANQRAVAAVAAITDKAQQRSEVALMIVRSLTESAGEATTVKDGPTEQAVLTMVAEDGVERRHAEEVARASPPGLNKGAVSAALRAIEDIRPALNPSQRTAVTRTLLRSASIIQGPPGTGKTLTAASVVVGAVLVGCGPVLATAASNVAVDNLLEKVLAVSRGIRRLRVVRVGRVAAVDESLWEHTLEAMLEKDTLVRRARVDAEKNPASATAAWEVEQAAASRIVRGADVVLTTCIGAGREVLAGLPFRLVLADEASQATEPDILVPLTVGNSETLRQVVLVGDHHQLPPTVLSDWAAPDGLGRSLFSRLWISGVMSAMLDTQYRMHPDISSFPSRHFYFGKLITAVDCNERELPHNLNRAAESFVRAELCGVDGQVLSQFLRKRRILFVNVQEGRDERDCQLRDTGSNFSYVNRDEARAACNIVRQLPYSRDDIGLISPYSGQVRLMSRILAAREDAPLEISTVDGFQGREKLAIVFSAVRSNNGGNVGFLADWRRLNVALTRAKSVLIVVGAFETLRQDENWSAWLKQAPKIDLLSLSNQPSVNDSPS